MTRRASAILIVGDDLDTPGTPAPGAGSAVDIIEQDLGKRFAGQLGGVVRLPQRARKQDVLGAFAQLRPTVASGELFIVMFAGHGAKPDRSTPAQSWYLSEHELFSDLELADELLALRDDVDAVVISDCCYGEGFFNTGVNIRLDTLLRGLRDTAARGGAVDDLLAGVEREQLQVQSTALGQVLRGRFQHSHRNSPMVCISAAAKDDLVQPPSLPDLAQFTVNAARDRQSYAELGALFETVAAGFATFHIDARPTTRINDLVLAT